MNENKTRSTPGPLDIGGARELRRQLVRLARRPEAWKATLSALEKIGDARWRLAVIESAGHDGPQLWAALEGVPFPKLRALATLLLRELPTGGEGAENIRALVDQWNTWTDHWHHHEASDEVAQ